jgi:hypothetical protein
MISFTTSGDQDYNSRDNRVQGTASRPVQDAPWHRGNTAEEDRICERIEIMKLMKLSIRIPLGLTMAVLIIGIVVFSKIHASTGMLPTTAFIIWLAVSAVLIGITVWSWMRENRKPKQP